MKNLRYLVVSSLFGLFTFLVVNTATAQVFIPVTNAQQMAMSADQTKLFVINDTTLSVYDYSIVNGVSQLTFAGSLFSAPTGANLFSLCTSGNNAVVTFSATNTGAYVINLSTGNVSPTVNLAPTATDNGQPFTIPFGGGCATLSDGTVMLGNNDNSASAGAIFLVPKLAILDPVALTVAYFDTTTTQPVNEIYAIPGTTQAAVVYGGASLNPSYNIAIVDSANMSAPVSFLPNVQSSSVPVFTGAQAYFTDSAGGEQLSLLTGNIVKTARKNYGSAQFTADNGYCFITYGNAVVTINNSCTGTAINTTVLYVQVDPFAQMLPPIRDTAYNVDHIPLLAKTGIVFADQVRPPSYIAAVTNAFSYQTGPITGNEWVAVFGAELGRSSFAATSTPLPTSLNGTTLTLQCPGQSPVAVQLNYVGSGQINALTPPTLSASTCPTVALVSTTTYADGTSTSAATTLQVADSAPGLAQDATGHVDVVNITTGAISTTAPVGSTVSMYGVGFGQTQLGAYGLQWDTTMPEILINGLAAQVLFAGLNPEFEGLYQLNVVIPQGVAAGDQPLQISIGAVVSPTAQIIIGQPVVQ